MSSTKTRSNRRYGARNFPLGGGEFETKVAIASTYDYNNVAIYQPNLCTCGPSMFGDCRNVGSVAVIGVGVVTRCETAS